VLRKHLRIVGSGGEGSAWGAMACTPPYPKPGETIRYIVNEFESVFDAGPISDLP